MTNPLRRLFQRLPTAVVIIGSLVGLVVAGGLLLWATLAITLSGGFGQWRLDHAPRPNFSGAAFVKLRDGVTREFAAIFDQAAIKPYQRYATSSSDACEKGEHNFAVRDPYAYVCSVQMTDYYGFDGDFRQEVLNLDKTLRAAGWASDAGADKTISDYYDKSYTGPGTDYTADSLPGALYTKDGISLEIAWIERGDTDLTLFENNLNPQSGSGVYQKHADIDPAVVAAHIFQEHRYGMSVALSKNYYSH